MIFNNTVVLSSEISLIFLIAAMANVLHEPGLRLTVNEP